MKNIMLGISLIFSFMALIAILSSVIVAILFLLISAWIYVLAVNFDKVNIIIKAVLFIFTLYYLQKLAMDFIY